MISDHFKLNDIMSMVYSVTDITAIKWKGDTPEQVSQFKPGWENVLENMDPNVDIGNEALRHVLYEQMTQSKTFDSEAKRYMRTPSDRAYRFLVSSIDRYLELDRMDRSRREHMLGPERGKATKVALTASSPDKDAKRSGGFPASTALSSGISIMYQAGDCQ